jgi:hypothetical protein
MKTAINKKFTITIFALLGVLVGCQSEVDKCTDALVKANGPYKTSEEKAQAEGGIRIACLKASKGN